MQVGIILFIIGAALIIYLSNITYRKRFIKKLGIVFGILILVYGLILTMQPDDYIKFTETTIVDKK
ncbi:MAG: hypothetical protein KAJ49_02380 [Arcobacteraceae bacterium]|nr:hypothetical protein [Arcobacteraceae bacterium]